MPMLPFFLNYHHSRFPFYRFIYRKRKKKKKKESIRSKERDAISRNNSKGRFLWFMKKKRVPGMRDPATPDKSRPLYDPNNQDPSIRVGAPTRFLRTPPRRRRSTYQSVVDSSPGSKEILSPVITYRELASPHTVRILPPTPEYFYNILPGIISRARSGSACRTLRFKIEITRSHRG